MKTIYPKYATIEQLNFENEIPGLMLQSKISDLEFKLDCIGTTRIAERKNIERRLAPLYKQLMNSWKKLYLK